MALFGTAGIRGPVDEITPSLALRVGRATARIADDGSEPPEVVVGRDGRTTGRALVDAVAAGLSSGGAHVLSVGRVPSPALAHASRGRYGVMLTASHNPPRDNGIKLFDDGVEFDSEAEGEIERLLDEGLPPVAWDSWRSVERAEVVPTYRTAVMEYARTHGSADPTLRIAVDCGNGMAAKATPQVLDALDVTVDALNANVDGHFPARGSKPTPDSLTALRRFVADGPAAAGIAHDGDADRIVVVNSKGTIVHEDTIVAILAEHYVSTSSEPDPVVVTTPNASSRIDERVVAAGGRVERVALGALHEGVARVREAGDPVAFAAEPWKHIHPDLGDWIDGVASAAMLARLIGSSGSLDRLRESVTERPYRKHSIECREEQKQPAMERLRRTIPDRFPDASISEEYGLRLDRPDGSWLLIRPSGTEPYLRIYAEGDEIETLVDTARNAVVSAVEAT